MSVKFTGELYVMTIRNDAKSKEELTCQFKIDMRNLTNFDPSTSKISKDCTLMGCFWPRYIMFELKKNRGVEFDGNEKQTCAFKNDMRNLANFHRLKNSNFILESKLVELNQNKSSKQPDWPDAAWKLYFTLEINE